MATTIVLITSTLLGAVGWWLGSFIGTISAYVLSVVGTAAGVYIGRRFAQEYLP